MKMCTVGPIAADAALLERALLQAKDSIDGQAKLVLLYAPTSARLPKLLSAAAVLGVPVVGCTTGGAAFTERGVATSEVVAGVLGGNDLLVHHTLVRGLGENVSVALGEAISSLPRGKFLGHTLMVLADPFACSGDRLVETIRKNTPVHWRCFGGLAGDDWSFRAASVFADQVVLKDAAVVIYLNTAVRPVLSLRHGFCALSGASMLNVTNAHDNTLISLDGGPAQEIYEAELRKLGLFTPGENFLTVAARYPLGIVTPFGEGMNLRTPMKLGERGAIILAGSIATGARVQVTSASDERLVTSASELAVDARFGSQGLAQLVVDCAGRRQLLGARYREQLVALGLGLSTPLLGFASYGEIARFGGNVEGFHNATTVVLRW